MESIPHTLARRSITLTRSTWMIIIIVVGSTLLVTIIILSMWFCLRHRRKKHATRPQREYKKLQKRSRGSSPDPKHLSSVDMTEPHRNSINSLSIPQYEMQRSELDTRDEEARLDASYQPQLELPQFPQRHPSQSSTYSWRPGHLAKGTVAAQDQSAQLIPPATYLPYRASSETVDLQRASSTRIANYHADTEYTDLISQDVRELLDNAGEAPEIPEKSRWRSRSISEGGTRPAYEDLQVLGAATQRGPNSFEVVARWSN